MSIASKSEALLHSYMALMNYFQTGQGKVVKENIVTKAGDIRQATETQIAKHQGEILFYSAVSIAAACVMFSLFYVFYAKNHVDLSQGKEIWYLRIAYGGAIVGMLVLVFLFAF